MAERHQKLFTNTSLEGANATIWRPSNSCLSKKKKEKMEKKKKKERKKKKKKAGG